MLGDIVPLVLLFGITGLTWLLRETESWEFTFLAAIAIGLVIEIYLRLQPAVLDAVFQQLQPYFQQNNLQGMEIEEIRETMTTIIGSVYMFLSIVLTMLARWMQASLFNPGGFQSEIHQLRIKQKVALILLGFSGGFRRSELVGIDYEDLDFVPEGVKIFVKRSKTDQSGEGMTKGIPYFSNPKYCPVVSLKKWIEKAKLRSGKIFDISDKSVALIIKKYTFLAGLDPNKYSGHSLRSGFATSTAELGAEERSIMAMTGHKTTQMVRRYIKEANLFKNNALNKIKI